MTIAELETLEMMFGNNEEMTEEELKSKFGGGDEEILGSYINEDEHEILMVADHFEEMAAEIDLTLLKECPAAVDSLPYLVHTDIRGKRVAWEISY